MSSGETAENSSSSLVQHHEDPVKTVCLMAATLRYLHICTSRTTCMDDPRVTAEEREEAAQVPDPEEFVAPPPPPSYFSTFYLHTPRLAHRMLGDSVIPLPHIYGARIKGVEVFCPLDPPPPYEAVAGSSTHTGAQDCEIHLSRLTLALPLQGTPVDAIYGEEGQLTHPQTTDSSTQTSQTTLARLTQVQVILRRTNERPLQRPRPSSMVDYQSYRHTQQLVRRILEQPTSQGLTDEVKELVASIRSVLQSDQEYMDEAVHSASYLEQVFTDSPVTPSGNAPSQQQGVGCSQTFPRPPRKPPGLLHLQSCGDLSSFTCSALDSADHQGGRIPRTRSGSQPDHPERPHSLIGVFRETVL